MSLETMKRLPRMRESAFIFPVIEDVLFLGQRATNPYAGMFGAIGGSVEVPGFVYSEATQSAIWHAAREAIVRPIKPYQSREEERAERRHQEYLLDELGDSIARYESTNMEHPLLAAVREMYEEFKPGVNMDEALATGDLACLTYIGWARDSTLSDEEKTRKAHFYIAHTTPEGIGPKLDEILSIKPAREVRGEDIWPLSRLALEHMRWQLNIGHSSLANNYQGLQEQIPQFPSLPRTHPDDKFERYALDASWMRNVPAPHIP